MGQLSRHPARAQCLRTSEEKSQENPSGRLAELASGCALERKAETIEQVARPLKTGVSGALWRTSTALTLASLMLAVMPGKSRGRREWAGVLGAAGSLALRMAVHYAGAASASDPRASFHQQRAHVSSDNMSS